MYRVVNKPAVNIIYFHKKINNYNNNNNKILRDTLPN